MFMKYLTAFKLQQFFGFKDGIHFLENCTGKTAKKQNKSKTKTYLDNSKKMSTFNPINSWLYAFGPNVFR